MKGIARVISICLILLTLFSFSGCVYSPGQMLEKGLTPKIQVFEVAPAVIDEGSVTYLRWQVENANSVSINNNIGDVALSGTVPVSPGSTTTYTLTAKNLAGETTANTQVIVNRKQSTQQNAPVIMLFSANRTSITPGEPVRISWNVTGATNVTITPIGQLDAQGTVEVYPTTTTAYILVATNAAGQSTASVTINVNPQPLAGMKTIVLNPVKDMSGSLVKGTGYLSYYRHYNICAGDTAMNLASRAFLSFDISSIPHNAVIQQATLDLGSYTQQGTPSYSRSNWGNMGALEIYFVEYDNLEDVVLNAYNKTGKLVAGGTYKDYPLSPWSLNVLNSENGEPVLQSLVYTGKTSCQFRIQFFSSTNWDSVADMLCFDGASLTIQYK